ncbi:GNAT family N-acetyltransferase [Paenibacillus antri]|uniref:GNAT family N-acetyltransferase n=1 Tax=Paenibacillus antri TaxID=2582848 RepID=A0A5R9GJV5_9BACL|nr:GNAT family N-acetyltransferase [Paenibacillus antri]TLS53183.1 GNAT family N-acetyltransferase [Paenibacillus antri]
MTLIRNLEPHELDASMTLSEFAFQYRVPTDEREARLAAMKPHQQWGAFVDGVLAAKYTLLDFETWIHGVKFAMGGLAGVATWPDYRRQGLVAKLLVHSLETMRANGQTVSFLHPFSFPFYRKFGWEYYTDTKKYDIPVAKLPPAPPETSRVRRVANDGALLDPTYAAYASRYSGTLVRSEEWWRERIFHRSQETTAAYTDASGTMQGYVCYEVKDRTLAVSELVALSEEARRALFGYLRNHDSMAETLTLSAPADDPLAFLLPDPRVKQELVPYFMARVVDAAAFVAAMPFVAGAGATVRLRVSDAHAPWNDGAWTLAVDDAGRGTLAPDESGAADGGALQCGIAAFTAMTIGARRPGFLHAAGLLQGPADAVEALERVLPARQTYLADFF